MKQATSGPNRSPLPNKLSCRRWCGRLSLAVLLALGGVSCGHGSPGAAANGRKVIVLGIDGMDPQLLEKFMDEGRMPHFRALAQPGHFVTLGTSTPPESPVAWGNFITGLDPGGHGIFDFIARDPKTMLPYLSTSQVIPPKHTLRLGSWVIPLSSGTVEQLRDGTAFWQVLDQHNIAATVYRAPSNFPPVATRGRTLAGMGTPDLRGSYGIFSFYTDNPAFQAGDVSGGRIYAVKVEGSKVSAQLEGPPNSFRKGEPLVPLDFTVQMDPSEPVAKVTIQDQEFVLRQGEWSDWVHLKFSLVPYLASVRGICRFYLKQVRPHFELYISPLNIDPADPALPLSTPADYAPELAQRLGEFYTQGIPEDTKALTAGVFTDGEFLEQAHEVLREDMRAYDYELNRFHEGFLFFYFSSVDQLSHMFWRTMDPHHPAYTPESAAEYGSVIADTYAAMDDALGKAMAKVDDHTTLIVMSDHGFAPFYRSFNLETWLVDNGYLVLRDRWRRAGSDIFTNVNWSLSRAYSLGIAGLYLNLRGREKNGIVGPEEKESLLDELTRKLLAVRDPATGEPVINHVYRAERVYHGPHVAEAPDLLIGYNRGYRAGWDTVLGRFSAAVLEDNREAWSGDHIIDPTLVPGVLLSNKEIRATAPTLLDLAPTILAEFGVEKLPVMKGHSVFTADAAGEK